MTRDSCRVFCLIQARSYQIITLGSVFAVSSHCKDSVITLQRQCHHTAKTVSSHCKDSVITLQRQCHHTAKTVPFGESRIRCAFSGASFASFVAPHHSVRLTPIIRCSFSAHLDLCPTERSTPCRFIETLQISLPFCRKDGRLQQNKTAATHIKQTL